MASDAESLADTVGFDLVGSDFGCDVESALKAALLGGAVFPEGTNPLVIFRKTLASSITDIETHPRSKLFQDFLLKGPYEDSGEIPAELVKQRLSDTETASAITFIYSHMVNCFKGAIAELLAARPCLHLLRRLLVEGRIPLAARLYVGDSVGVHRSRGAGVLKGADLHILDSSAPSATSGRPSSQTRGAKPSTWVACARARKFIRRLDRSRSSRSHGFSSSIAPSRLRT